MELAVVIGQVVSTVKSAGVHKERLLLVDFVDAEGKSHGRPQVAADSIGAGDGEWVLVVRGSSARRVSENGDALPIDLSVMGIVDEVVLQGRLAYRK